MRLLYIQSTLDKEHLDNALQDRDQFPARGVYRRACLARSPRESDPLVTDCTGMCGFAIWSCVPSSQHVLRRIRRANANSACRKLLSDIFIPCPNPPIFVNEIIRPVPQLPVGSRVAAF